LVALRTQLAKEQGVPSYIIFNDKSLREMAQKRPQNLESLGQIGGVGKSKLEKYGTLFLDTIRTYPEKVAG
jgi:ATP-dependent DNA helicase RecQ